MKESEIFVREIAGQISMPVIYTDIRTLIIDEEATIQDFVEVLEQDRMLSSRLIQIAKSGYFGFSPRANNLHQAISLIGIMQLHDLILNCLCLRTFSSIPQQIFNLEAFWKYSVECGIAGRTLAQYAQVFPLNPYFTLGLLHEIGHAVMFVREPELSGQALEESETENVALIERENALFGFDYTEAGDCLMQLWGLPDRFQQTAAFHLQPEMAQPSHLQAVNIIGLAHKICQDPGADEIPQCLQDAKRLDPELKKLPDNIVDIIIKEISTSADDVLNMLLPYAERGNRDPNGVPIIE